MLVYNVILAPVEVEAAEVREALEVYLNLARFTVCKLQQCSHKNLAILLLRVHSRRYVFYKQTLVEELDRNLDEIVVIDGVNDVEVDVCVFNNFHLDIPIYKLLKKRLCVEPIDVDHHTEVQQFTFC